MQYWLVKSEPDVFGWEDLVRDGTCTWDGVRNYMARNNLRDMRLGDIVLFYHSVIGKEVVGLARVSRESFADPTDEKWLAVEMVPLAAFKRPVTLTEIKAQEKLKNLMLVRQGRLSVMPVTVEEFELILQMGETKRPA